MTGPYASWCRLAQADALLYLDGADTAAGGEAVEPAHAAFFRPDVTVRSTPAHTPNLSPRSSAACPHGSNTGQPPHIAAARRRSAASSDSQSQLPASEQCGLSPRLAAVIKAWVSRLEDSRPRPLISLLRHTQERHHFQPCAAYGLAASYGPMSLVSFGG
jgi:hypothetical protein